MRCVCFSYLANILADICSQLQLDTGSSDLWVDTQGNAFTNVIDTNIGAQLVYG